MKIGSLYRSLLEAENFLKPENIANLICLLSKKFYGRFKITTITQKRITREELIKRSFEFLLKREPKESILSRFNLKVINRHFPEYESKIKLN